MKGYKGLFAFIIAAIMAIVLLGVSGCKPKEEWHSVMQKQVKVAEVYEHGTLVEVEIPKDEHLIHATTDSQGNLHIQTDNAKAAEYRFYIVRDGAREPYLLLKYKIKKVNF